MMIEDGIPSVNPKLDAMCEMLKALDTLTEKNKALEKENTELKECNKMLEQGYVWHDYDAGEDCYEDTHEGKWVKRDEVYQLAKAKEYLNLLLMDSPDIYRITGKTIPRILVEVKQFLKETEEDG